MSKQIPRVRAPELPKNFTWLNADRPLLLKNLRNHHQSIVLLDFWTYCCINCIHVLPDLKYLERKYRDVLTVIGVHCGKFDNEKDVENVRNAILRHDIEHPVILDKNFYLWQQYTVRAYPTFVLIDLDGYIVNQMSGEGNRDKLDLAIENLLHNYKDRYSDRANASLLEYKLEKHQPSRNHFFRFPHNLLATSMGLFIADSGNHRIIWQNYHGDILDIIGNGQAGLQDGDFNQAEFSSPQGIAVDNNTRILYVADTENHALRKVDLVNKTVTKIAGTGSQNRSFTSQVGIATDIPLNSPWDIALFGDSLWITMAGLHQIWQLDLNTHYIQTFAGTGAEGCVDGNVSIAAFAQPSGITSDGKVLYIADSETSTIRYVTINPPIQVGTVCGSGDLYGFGDRDGTGEYVRLQHPLGVEYSQGNLWIADTYNHKIKRINPQTGECKTVVLDKAIKLAEPSGLSLWDQGLYIADTNHHRVIFTEADLLS